MEIKDIGWQSKKRFSRLGYRVLAEMHCFTQKYSKKVFVDLLLKYTGISLSRYLNRQYSIFHKVCSGQQVNVTHNQPDDEQVSEITLVMLKKKNASDVALYENNKVAVS